MYQLFSKDTTSDIFLLNPSECVLKAAKNLQENLRTLSGKDGGFGIVAGKTGLGIVIQTGPSAPNYPEGYRVQIDDDGVVITGFDDLGTIYGIYGFLTKILNIDPMYRFTDVFPKAQEALSLTGTSFCSTKKEVPFRGWFVNDEDFLSGYKTHGDKRKIYHNQSFFKEIISAEMIDIICETALRLEMNFLIPCSYLDILNPAEEEIVKAVVSSGMYISMHHQEPVGTGHFAAFNYFEEHFTGKTVSYIANPKEMETVWRLYISRWAKYGKHVIWQLGLRGQGDMAVWRTDPNISSSPEKRGGIISEVVDLQRRLITEALGTGDFISTMTLWMEAAELYDKGFLEIPESVIVVFSDLGSNQLMCPDFYNVARNENGHYGIYYHAALHIEGPHFTDGVHPRKMLFCYQEAERKNSLTFSVLNVGNVREVCPSIRLNAEILKGKPSAFRMEDYFKNVYPALFGDVWEEVAKLDIEYFDSIGDLGKALLTDFFSSSDFHLQEYENLPYTYFPLTDGTTLRIGATFLGDLRNPASQVFTHNETHFETIQEAFLQSIGKYTKLLPKISKLQNQIPEEALTYYRFSRVYRTRYMLNVTQWAYCASEMYKGHDTNKNRELAELALNNILSFRNEFTRGKWQGWYDNDLRHNIPARLELTQMWWKHEDKLRTFGTRMI